MSISESKVVNAEYGEQILEYIESSQGLKLGGSQTGQLEIFQSVDGKSLSFCVEAVEEVIDRVDSGGQNFLQVNFHSGHKILLTNDLVGFKPAVCPGLDMGKLPKVVTTPDLISVIEAIEETMHTDGTHPVEVEVLRRVFRSVLKGAEDVGFNLSQERAWVQRIVQTNVNPEGKAAN